MSAGTESHADTHPSPEDGRSPIEAVDRALIVLKTLASAGTLGLVLSEIAAGTGLHKTTVHRTLAALRHRDFVVQDPVSGRYALGGATIDLGEAYLSSENLAHLLHPALVAVAADVDELVHLGVLSGRQIVYLDKVEPERPVRVWSAIGRRFPAATTALGRALLAYRIDRASALAGYADGLEAATDRIWEALRQARDAGYSVEIEENEPGIGCVAVPLLRGNEAVAAISVTVPVDRLSAARVTYLHERLSAVLPSLLPPWLHLADPTDRP